MDDDCDIEWVGTKEGKESKGGLIIERTSEFSTFVYPLFFF